ncbi:MAG: fatty acid desaturase [Opitutaceae bacterium]|nr:fatty acid desaturase [Opitutaceae bacterium]
MNRIIYNKPESSLIEYSPEMTENVEKLKSINWYRTKLDRQAFKDLHRRSDRKGFLQASGHLVFLLLTGLAAWLSVGNLPLIFVLLLLLLHGTFFAFILNGFHELIHRTVFTSKRLNGFFLNIYSFIGIHNPILFWASHTEHHKYTLHPPRDLEVVLPVALTLKGFLSSGLIDPIGLYQRIKQNVRLASGRLEGDWENALFPESKPEERKKLFAWARILLFGHATILAISIYFQLWFLPVITTLAPFYGSWLLYFCNHAQHTGLQNNKPDFRFCCRTIILHPVVQFLYWHMNYHTEHHMYASVPCYNLGKLHQCIKHDLPRCPVGLIETWKQIVGILKKQKNDPSYQYIPVWDDNLSDSRKMI